MKVLSNPHIIYSHVILSDASTKISLCFGSMNDENIHFIFPIRATRKLVINIILFPNLLSSFTFLSRIVCF